jgi:hypothetical protein
MPQALAPGTSTPPQRRTGLAGPLQGNFWPAVTTQVSYDNFLAGIHPDDRPATNAAVQQALDPAGTGTYNIEHRTRWQEGGPTQWARATGKAFFDADRTPAQRFIGTITDVTEHKALLDRVTRAHEELEMKVSFRNLELEREVRQLRAQVANAGS